MGLPYAIKQQPSFKRSCFGFGDGCVLAEKPEVSAFLEAMTVRFLEFLSVNKHWKQRYNHNHLRISRAIQSLRLLHSWELANWFYNKV